jgi:hypothetical protein
MAGRRIKRRCREDNWEKRRRIEGVRVVGSGDGGNGRSIGGDFLISAEISEERGERPYASSCTPC